jgi:hypothetical protein
VTLWNISHIQVLVIYFDFQSLPIKLNLGLQWIGDNSQKNHREQSRWLANQKQGVAVRSYLLHFSLASVQLCCASYKPQQNRAKKCWAKLACFDIQFLFAGSHTEHPWSCSSTSVMMSGWRVEDSSSKTCIISREYIIGSIVPNWGECQCCLIKSSQGDR